MVMEADTGQLRLLKMAEDGPPPDFSQSVWEAAQSPMVGDPYKPGKLLVSQKELFQAVKPLARMQKIQLELEPDIGLFLEELKAQLEEEFKDGPGMHFLIDEDVDPELVREYFQRFCEFLEVEPWHRFPSSQALLLRGLEQDPIWITVMGNLETGLGVCLTREAVEAVFSGHCEPDDVNILSALLDENPGPALRQEVAEYGWPVADDRIPIVIRGGREERPHPTEAELRLLCDAFEAVTSVARSPFRLVLTSFELSSGREVEVCIDDSIELKPDLNDERRLSLSLTLGQRKMVAERIPEFSDSLQLGKKSRLEVELPLDACLYLQEYLSTHLHTFRGATLTIGRDLFIALRDSLEEFESDSWQLELCDAEDWDEEVTELSEEAAYSEINEIVSAFEKSKEFQTHKRGPGDRSGVTVLLEFAYQYCGVGPSGLTEDIVDDVLLNVFPRKMCMDIDESLLLLEEFRSFLAFTKRTQRVPASGECITGIDNREFKQEFIERLSDPRYFGMAKSLFAGMIPAAPPQTQTPKKKSKKNRKKTEKKSRKKNRKK